MNNAYIFRMFERIKYSSFFSEKVVCYLIYIAIESIDNYEDGVGIVLPFESIAERMHISEDDFNSKWSFLSNDFSIDDTAICLKNGEYLSEFFLFSEVNLNSDKKEITFIISPVAVEVIRGIDLKEIEVYIDSMAMFNTSMAFSLYKILISGNEKRGFFEIFEELEKNYCFFDRDIDIELECDEDILLEMAIAEINEVSDIQIEYKILNRAECDANDGIILISKSK